MASIWLQLAVYGYRARHVSDFCRIIATKDMVALDAGQTAAMSAFLERRGGVTRILRAHLGAAGTWAGTHVSDFPELIGTRV